MLPALHLIFFASGVSGLIYEVVWVREFSRLFGNTVYSAALVTGVFILGLGAGAWIAGAAIDGRHARRPSIALDWYVRAELAVAILGFLVTLALPRIEILSPLISAYSPGRDGWFELTAASHLLRAALCAALIGPITLLMGATLVLLIRHATTSARDDAARTAGFLYGANVLGAALGCAAVDAWLVPAFGLRATQLFAVSLNLAAAACAGLLSRFGRPSAAAPSGEAAPIAGGPKLEAGARALAVAGFGAMGMQIVWLRFLTSLYSARRPSFSMTLLAILTGMGLGAIIGGALSRRMKASAGRLFAVSQLSLGLSTLAGFMLFMNTNKYIVNLGADAHLGQERLAYRILEQWGFLIPALKVAFIPSLLIGAAFPLINGFASRAPDDAGGRAGTLCLWNAAGSLLGSLITAFLILPKLGMQNAAALLGVIAGAAAFPVLAVESRKLAAASTAIMLVTLVCWLRLPPGLLARQSILDEQIESAGKSVEEISEGIGETAMVVRDGKDGSLELFTDGHRMAGTSYLNQRYMRALAHLPLLQLEKPDTALVMCFGAGNTAHAASLHPVSRLDIVDLSRNVLGLASRFEATNRGVLRDPRARVFVNDGRQHLRMTPDDSYDLITLEPPPLVCAGTASLYSKEFYALARGKLKNGGFLTQWLPIHQVAGERSREMIKAFVEAFPDAVLLNGAGHELMLMGRKGAENRIDWRSVEKRVASRPRVGEDLRRINLSTPAEFLGSFMASGRTMTESLRRIAPLSDDLPSIEYSRYLVVTTLPSELIVPDALADWCPSCFSGKDFAPDGLAAYLSLMTGIYASPQYLLVGMGRAYVPPGVPPGVSPDEFRSWYRSSPQIRDSYPAPR